MTPEENATRLHEKVKAMAGLAGEAFASLRAAEDALKKALALMNEEEIVTLDPTCELGMTVDRIRLVVSRAGLSTHSAICAMADMACAQEATQPAALVLEQPYQRNIVDGMVSGGGVIRSMKLFYGRRRRA